MNITSVNGDYVWKFHEDMMTGTWWKWCKGWTDRPIDTTVQRAAWPQLNISDWISMCIFNDLQHPLLATWSTQTRITAVKLKLIWLVITTVASNMLMAGWTNRTIPWYDRLSAGYKNIFLNGNSWFSNKVYWILFLIVLINVMAWSRLSTKPLTHWSRVTHICVDDLTINGSDNGLAPGWRQAIIRTNAGILLIGPLACLGTNVSEISIEILTFSFKKMHLKMLSVKLWPFCLSPNMLTEPVHWLICITRPEPFQVESIAGKWGHWIASQLGWLCHSSEHSHLALCNQGKVKWMLQMPILRDCCITMISPIHLH